MYVLLVGCVAVKRHLNQLTSCVDGKLLKSGIIVERVLCRGSHN